MGRLGKGARRRKREEAKKTEAAGGPGPMDTGGAGGGWSTGPASASMDTGGEGGPEAAGARGGAPLGVKKAGVNKHSKRVSQRMKVRKAKKRAMGVANVQKMAARVNKGKAKAALAGDLKKLW